MSTLSKHFSRLFLKNNIETGCKHVKLAVMSYYWFKERGELTDDFQIVLK